MIYGSFNCIRRRHITSLLAQLLSTIYLKKIDASACFLSRYKAFLTSYIAYIQFSNISRGFGVYMIFHRFSQELRFVESSGQSIYNDVPKTPRCYFLLKHYSICHKNITVIDTVLLPLLPLLPQLASSFYFSSVYHLLRWSNSAIKLNCEQTSLLVGKVLQQRFPSTQFHFRSLLLHPSSNLYSHQTTVPSVAFNSQ